MRIVIQQQNRYVFDARRAFLERRFRAQPPKKRSMDEDLPALCSTCGGTGEDYERRCRSCGGTGEVPCRVLPDWDY